MCAMKASISGFVTEILILSPDLISLKFTIIARCLQQEITCYKIFSPSTAYQDIISMTKTAVQHFDSKIGKEMESDAKWQY